MVPWTLIIRTYRSERTPYSQAPSQQHFIAAAIRPWPRGQGKHCWNFTNAMVHSLVHAWEHAPGASSVLPSDPLVDVGLRLKEREHSRLINNVQLKRLNNHPSKISI